MNQDELDLLLKSTDPTEDLSGLIQLLEERLCEEYKPLLKACKEYWLLHFLALTLIPPSASKVEGIMSRKIYVIDVGYDLQCHVYHKIGSPIYRIYVEGCYGSNAKLTIKGPGGVELSMPTRVRRHFQEALFGQRKNEIAWSRWKCSEEKLLGIFRKRHPHLLELGRASSSGYEMALSYAEEAYGLDVEEELRFRSWKLQLDVFGSHSSQTTFHRLVSLLGRPSFGDKKIVFKVVHEGFKYELLFPRKIQRHFDYFESRWGFDSLYKNHFGNCQIGDGALKGEEDAFKSYEDFNRSVRHVMLYVRGQFSTRPKIG